MHAARVLASIVVGLSLVAGVRAQPAEAPPPPADQIVVTGTRDRDEQVRDFVRALTPARSGAVPRFIDAVCPHVTGMVPAAAERVVARLRATAAAGGLRVLPPGCVPNAFLIIARDKGAFIRALARTRPDSFGLMTAAQIRRLARTPGPAAAWVLEGPVDADGIPLRFDESIGAYRDDTVVAASRLRTASARGFDASALVVEAAALNGLTGVQLADYAAMRLFAKLDPARLEEPLPPTILTVLTTPMGQPVQITMSEWDLGFLRGLYAGAGDLSPSGMRSRITREVTRRTEAATSPEE